MDFIYCPICKEFKVGRNRTDLEFHVIIHYGFLSDFLVEDFEDNDKDDINDN